MGRLWLHPRKENTVLCMISSMTRSCPCGAFLLHAGLRTLDAPVPEMQKEKKKQPFSLLSSARIWRLKDKVCCECIQALLWIAVGKVNKSFLPSHLLLSAGGEALNQEGIPDYPCRVWGDGTGLGSSYHAGGKDPAQVLNRLLCDHVTRKQ